MFVTALQIPWTWSIRTLAVGPDITVGGLFRALPRSMLAKWLLSSLLPPSPTATRRPFIAPSTLHEEHTPFILIIILIFVFAADVGAVARLTRDTLTMS